MAAMTSHKILLIDDYAVFRAGLSTAINTAISGTTIFEAGSVNDAISHTPDAIDVVLLDIELNDLSGLDGIELLKRKWPFTPILILSSHDAPETVRGALARGAAGFVSKAVPAERIIEAIQLVLRGSFPKLSPATGSSALRRLTSHQCDVLNLLHKGLSSKIIARQLALSENTVRLHVQDILEFFQVVSRAEAMYEAHRQGLVG